MRRAILALGVTMVTCCVIGGTLSMRTAKGEDLRGAVGANGRFQLVAAKYTVMGKSTSLQYDGLFQIDSATGQVWIFKAGIVEVGGVTQAYEAFVPVRNVDLAPTTQPSGK